jgi:hypothetical protein
MKFGTRRTRLVLPAANWEGPWNESGRGRVRSARTRHPRTNSSDASRRRLGSRVPVGPGRWSYATRSVFTAEGVGFRHAGLAAQAQVPRRLELVWGRFDGRGKVCNFMMRRRHSTSSSATDWSNTNTTFR